MGDTLNSAFRKKCRERDSPLFVIPARRRSLGSRLGGRGNSPTIKRRSSRSGPCPRPTTMEMKLDHPAQQCARLRVTEDRPMPLPSATAAIAPSPPCTTASCRIMRESWPRDIPHRPQHAQLAHPLHDADQKRVEQAQHADEERGDFNGFCITKTLVDRIEELGLELGIGETMRFLDCP